MTQTQALTLTDLVEDTPELVIDLGIARANIERAAEVARRHGVTLRPHAKTHKMPQIAALQLAAGSPGIQVAKLTEAEIMVDAGVDDVLVGYPIVGASKLTRLTALAERSRVSVSLDSEEVARGISHAAHERGVTVRILVEVDTGQARLGVQPGPPAADLAERVAVLPGLELVGVLTHEGHAVISAHSPEESERLTQQACEAMAETASLIRERGLPLEVVSVGSSPTFRFAVRCPGVTEVRPGTYVFNDRTQLAHGAAMEENVAAFVVATVVSRPEPGRAVVDAGTKALSSDQLIVPDAGRSYGAVAGRPGWVLGRASEEHGVVSIPADASLRVGDRLAIIPNHVCPVVNLFDRATIIENGQVVDCWPIAARGCMR